MSARSPHGLPQPISSPSPGRQRGSICSRCTFPRRVTQRRYSLRAALIRHYHGDQWHKYSYKSGSPILTGGNKVVLMCLCTPQGRACKGGGGLHVGCIYSTGHFNMIHAVERMDVDAAQSNLPHNRMMGRAVLNKGECKGWSQMRCSYLLNTYTTNTCFARCRTPEMQLFCCLLTSGQDVFSSLLFGDGNNVACSLTVPTCYI